MCLWSPDMEELEGATRQASQEKRQRQSGRSGESPAVACSSESIEAVMGCNRMGKRIEYLVWAPWQNTVARARIVAVTPEVKVAMVTMVGDLGFASAC